MAKVNQIDSKTWQVTGASADEVARAARAASAKRSPIDHGGVLCPIAREALKLMVGMSTYDTVAADGRSGAKTHMLGAPVYRTAVTVEQRGNVVEVRRKTRGILGPVAEVATNLGRAIEAELND